MTCFLFIEFAALQTAVSDLTSDIEGGNVLFRDYDVYACKTLFTAQKMDPLMSPPAVVVSCQIIHDSVSIQMFSAQVLLKVDRKIHRHKTQIFFWAL